MDTKKTKDIEVDTVGSACNVHNNHQCFEKVGDMIKNAREGKKIDIFDVAKTLCIRRVYLEAIENSNYQALPEFPYSVGFVKSYADYLGLNGARVADLFRSELNIQSELNEPDTLIEAELDTPVPGRKYLIISVVALFLVYILWLIFRTSGGPDTFDDSLAVLEDNAEQFSLQVEDFTTEEGVVVLEEDYVSDEEDLGQVKVEDGEYIDSVSSSNNAPLSIEVKMLRDNWFEARDAQKLYVSKEFKSGSSYIVPDVKGVVLSVGRPEAVEVYIDGKKVDVFTNNRRSNVSLDAFLNN